MRSGKVWIFLSILLVVLILGTQNTYGYARGRVTPSGNGDTCPNGSNPCVGLSSGGLLEVGNGTTITEYSLFGVEGVTDGSTVTFSFSSFPGVDASGANYFNILECGSDPTSASNLPGIYTTGGQNLNILCSQEGVTTISEVDNIGAGTIALTFSGNLLSSTWGFAELQSPGAPQLEGIQLSIPTPEPASLSLLAAGLIGLGVIRRKRTA
jgi:PEP-CTERM motif